jgi:hypothetical protein
MARAAREVIATACVALLFGCMRNTIGLLGDTEGDDLGDVDEGGPHDDDLGDDGPGATSMHGAGDDDTGDPSSPTDPSDTTDSGPAPAFCGDGERGPDEECDGSDLGGETCRSLGAFGGELSCDENCVLDVQDCSFEPPTCGDGVAQGDEACDGADLRGSTCSDVPWANGSGLACTEECELDATACAVADGAVVISEVFYAPLLVPLAVPGQWFELHNPSASTTVQLAGCTIDGGSIVQTFSLGSLSIPPGGWVTLGAGTPGDLGMVPDYVTPPAFILMNEGDVIELSCGGELLDSLEYGNVEPWPAFQPGVSISLRPDRLKPFANDDGAAWCAANAEYAMGQRGTPAAPSDCP